MNVKSNTAILNYSDSIGGAARAAVRLQECIKLVGVNSVLLVSKSSNKIKNTEAYPKTPFLKIVDFMRLKIGRLVLRLFSPGNDYPHSLALLPSFWPFLLRQRKFDLVHLTWINSEMMSIGDIRRIKGAVIWTLQDMWAFCGAEHISHSSRWIEGYLASNRPVDETGIDINRWVWKRKKRNWSTPKHIVAPSNWMAECVKKSALLKDWPVTVIPNPINTDEWFPEDRAKSRSDLGLPLKSQLILFGCYGGVGVSNKGFDLLREALKYLEVSEVELVVLGDSGLDKSLELGFPIHFLGDVRDDLTLRLAYSACDVIAIPSRIDNLPNMGLEAHACGAPVVAFNVSGMPDIVSHLKTGYLATPFDTLDFSRGLSWVLRRCQSDNELGRQAREKAIDSWSYPVVGEQYKNIYQQVIAKEGNNERC